MKMAGSSQLSINHLLPKYAHSAIVCGQTGCGKTVFILDLLEGPYRGFFRHIVVLCPTIEHNKTYKQCPWLWKDPEVYVLDPGERLQDYLRAFYLVFKGEPTLQEGQARTTARTASGSQGIISSPCRRWHACQYSSKGSGSGFRG